MKKFLEILRSAFGHTFFIINLVVAGWLFVCLYATNHSPVTHKYIAIFSLTTPFALTANFIFIFIWIFTRKKWRIALPILSLICCHSLIKPVFGLHFFDKNKMAAEVDGLKILSWNVHGLGLFDKPVDKMKPEQIFELIEEQEPDILCMIEYYTNADGSNTKASTFFKEAGYKEYRFSYDNDFGSKIFIGNAVFSKYPLSNFEEIQIDEYIKMMRCDVSMPDSSTIRLFVMHLQSFLLGDQEKAFIEDVKHNTEKLEQKPGYSKTFLEKFQRAYAKRASQAEMARKQIAESPYPVVICADFNDVPGSYTYTTVKGNLKDAFAEKGRGIGRTYNFLSPTLRIDYIFYDCNALDLLGYQSIKTDLSDHNPIIANFARAKEKK